MRSTPRGGGSRRGEDGKISLHTKGSGRRGVWRKGDPRDAECGNEASTSLTSKVHQGTPPRVAHAPIDESARARPGDPDSFVDRESVGPYSPIHVRWACLYADRPSTDAGIEKVQYASCQREVGEARRRHGDRLRGREGMRSTYGEGVRTTGNRDTGRRRAAVGRECGDEVPHPSRILAVSTGAGDARGLMLQQLLLLLRSPPPRWRAT